VAEQGCLLSSYPGKTGIGGSNPPLSAILNISERTSASILQPSSPHPYRPFGNGLALLRDGKFVLASCARRPQGLQLCVSRYNVRVTIESVPRTPERHTRGNALCAR
jgi:hypothetical protein